jgi:hypothetical protein
LRDGASEHHTGATAGHPQSDAALIYLASPDSDPDPSVRQQRCEAWTLAAVRDAAGHANVSITSAYLHIDLLCS